MIRKATEDDLERVAILYKKAGLMPGLSDEMILSLISNGVLTQTFVLENKGQIAAAATFDWYNRRQAEVSFLAVEEEYRGNGEAFCLIREAFPIVSQSWEENLGYGISLLKLNTKTDNLPAQKVFEDLLENPDKLIWKHSNRVDFIGKLKGLR